MREREVIVVGSGPAGASCAKALRDEGVDVLVLEKKALPRYKCCSGILFGQTQELLKRYFNAEAPASVTCAPADMEAGDVREWNAEKGYRPYLWEIGKDGKSFPQKYVNIWRNLFDKWLLDLSAAEYRDQAYVKGFEKTSQHIRVQVAQSAEGELATYHCKYLVGADGWNSTVRRLLNPESAKQRAAQSVGVLQSYFKLESLGSLKKGAFTVFFLPEVGDTLTCVHQKGDYLLLCVGGFKGRKLRESMVAFKHFLSRQFEVRLGDWWRDESCQMLLAPPDLGREQVLLTGEAANFIYLNGEGISTAIDSGYRCGKAIAAALREKKSALPLYAETITDIAAHMEKCFTQIRFLVSQAT
ncbi:MAG: NAD(P)/FAD-dependent oxidoreductase [Desulfobacterales bacterium]|jgi:flavin-dependent dehydrogenase|nr:NAD(P)/FAD-dependent oxidoreductase [Desulfobacterales bacterium]